MAHKTLIGGTAYEISGGRTLVNGTGYSIDKGRTLVGGTAYEVGFEVGFEKTAIVRLMSNTFTEIYYAEASVFYRTPDGGTGYLSTAGEYELPIGTIITCSLRWNGKDMANLIVYFNHSVIDSSESDAYYQYTLNQNIAIMPVNYYYNGGYIHISEVPENPVVFILGSNEYLYGAESGATWEEFVYSDYNFVSESGLKISISGDTVVDRYNSVIKYNGTNVKPTDRIIDGATYRS